MKSPPVWRALFFLMSISDEFWFCLLKVDVGKNLSPVPFPSQGKGRKKRGGEAPSLKYLPLSFEERGIQGVR